MLLFLGRKLFKKEQDGGNGGLSLQVCSVSKKVLHLEQFDASGMVKLPKSAHEKCPHRIIFLCLELEQIGDHIYYTNGGYLYSKCGLRFALAQSINFFYSVWALFMCTFPFLGEPCQKHFHT